MLPATRPIRFSSATTFQTAMICAKHCEKSACTARRAPRKRLFRCDALVHVLCTNRVQNRTKRDNAGEWCSFVFLHLVVWRCTTCRPESHFEPEGREFESLRAHQNPLGSARTHGLQNVPAT